MRRLLCPVTHYFIVKGKSNSICGALAVVEKKKAAAGMCYYVFIQGIHPRKGLAQS